MAARMLLNPGISAARERANKPEAIPSQLSYDNSSAPISNVEVKDIKVASCGNFTQ